MVVTVVSKSATSCEIETFMTDWSRTIRNWAAARTASVPLAPFISGRLAGDRRGLDRLRRQVRGRGGEDDQRDDPEPRLLREHNAEPHGRQRKPQSRRGGRGQTNRDRGREIEAREVGRHHAGRGAEEE